MSPVLIHFGVDDCYRVPVLKKAGFLVEECTSLRRLQSALVQLPEPDAVAVAENDEIEAKDAMLLARSNCKAPLVLFQGRSPGSDTSGFNLVVPPLTDPRVWLNDLASLIGHSRILRGQSQAIRAQSALLRSQVAQVVEKSRRERRRSASLTGQPRLAALSMKVEVTRRDDDC
jgi:hypothetical protein